MYEHRFFHGKKKQNGIKPIWSETDSNEKTNKPQEGRSREEGAAVFTIEDDKKNNRGRYFSFEQFKQDT